MRFRAGWSAASATTLLCSFFLRLCGFEVRMWRPKAWLRTTLPEPVFLNRLDAPLCVLSFGIVIPWNFSSGRLSEYSTRASAHGLARDGSAKARRPGRTLGDLTDGLDSGGVD